MYSSHKLVNTHTYRYSMLQFGIEIMDITTHVLQLPFSKTKLNVSVFTMATPYLLSVGVSSFCYYRLINSFTLVKLYCQYCMTGVYVPFYTVDRTSRFNPRSQ